MKRSVGIGARRKVSLESRSLFGCSGMDLDFAEESRKRVAYIRMHDGTWHDVSFQAKSSDKASMFGICAVL